MPTRQCKVLASIDGGDLMKINVDDMVARTVLKRLQLITGRTP